MGVKPGLSPGNKRHRTDQKCIQNLCLKTNEKALSDDLDVDGGVIFKQIFKDWRERM
jgi:hypothetical protein